MTTDELKKHMANVPGEPCGKTLRECMKPWNHRRYANLKAELDRLDEDTVMLNDFDDEHNENEEAVRE